MLLVKLPVPVPSVVLVVKAIVGFWLVLHTTPLAVIAPPPSLVILPPLLAVVEVIEETVVVVRVARLAWQGPQLGWPLQKVKTCPCAPAGKTVQLVPLCQQWRCAELQSEYRPMGA